MKHKILLPLFILALSSGGLPVTDLYSNSAAKKIRLQWDTPPEGSAVSYENDNEYLRQRPVLRSGKTATEKLTTEINLAPTLQRLILPGSENQVSEGQNEEEIFLNNLGLRAAQKAIEFLDKGIQTVNVNGSVLNIQKDCSYFVRAVYWEGSDHKLDLFRESIITNAIDPNTATGVTLLSEYLRKNRRYQSGNPRVGDIIIFDNTYDKNQNQKRDDFYTHTGIVTNIRADQTIEFIHGNISQTIKKGYINFRHKNDSTVNGQPVNSYIRPRYNWETGINTSLASYLVRAFGGL